eukprot:CAMPEP_0180301208 /NCGR_PEP_ID=MMETSP0988-20121125/23325_1 /TAXON_ID=697907 /ORGANISM="non described non described, Strain CCMP2293" /LENGTH=111 /DNA_ID=CAMNT_0022281669 /DNA_START=331 /DNA_END=662 /DNA_ORIENTATION=-
MGFGKSIELERRRHLCAKTSSCGTHPFEPSSDAQRWKRRAAAAALAALAGVRGRMLLSDLDWEGSLTQTSTRTRLWRAKERMDAMVALEAAMEGRARREARGGGKGSVCRR